MVYFVELLWNQKAPSKGGHHLGLFDPTTHLFDTGRFPGAWPTSQTLGPAGYRGCYVLKDWLSSGGNTYTYNR